MSRRADLSVPKSGASRFSKALPTVPGLDDYDDDDSESNIGSSNNNHNRNNSEYNLPARTSSLASPPPTKNLPLPPLPPQPPTKTLPATPQPNRVGANNSYNNTIVQTSIAAPSVAPSSSTPTSAQSVDILSLQSPPLSGRSMMAIPRKPIANLQLPSPSPQFLAQPSPTFSLSSLLSAYMGDGDESFRESLYETTTSVSETERQEVAAPGSEKPVAATAVVTPPSKPEALAKPPSSIGGSGSLPARPNIGIGAGTGAPAQYQRPADRNLPPPPPKDDKIQIQKPRSSTPEPAAAPPATTPELSSPSSPRPEIWKRRPHMSQASRELPGLKLDYSHGSTADTQLPSDLDNSQAASETTKATTQRAPPFPGGLPGRNIRPSLPAKDQPPPATQTMGSETSKLKQIKNKLGSQRSESVSSTSSAKAGFPGAPAVQRPPTPEYQKEDVKEPVVDRFISPVSPASSPEAPRGASPDFSKDLPPQPPKDERAAATSAQKPIARKALPTNPGQDLTTAKNESRPASDAKSTAASSQAAVSPQLPKVDAILAPVASTPTDTASTRSRVSGGTTVVQPQPAAIQADAPQTEKPQRTAPQATSDPRLLQSESQGLLYRGRDGTLYPEMKNDGEPHPKAAYFPTQKYSNLLRDGVVKARPLTDTHFDCFQQHRNMNRRSNRNCPLTCQTCDGADLEDRWVCTFCHLRICDACHRKLGNYQRDLRRLVDSLVNAGPLGLTSQSRPGTASGLQATL
ncbi:hypothetical protein TARUN_2276 [Trichoderma arundinaceum]|uniref:Uncharacterized protein n=1 Tax=Trichoderma arundinaceum TaxID=490622 RepID=A0A395NUW8_TRIAR|nr:hypothetical protein TARUN_2276 [Trichoderma arundinaceum]